MLRPVFFLFSVAFLLYGLGFTQIANGQQPVNGVSANLAQSRKSLLSLVRYQLNFTIPSISTAPVKAEEVILFQLSKVKGDLQLDFKAASDAVSLIEVNGVKSSPSIINEHLVLPAKLLRNGENRVRIHFTAGNGALNRNEDYLYTLFVPDRARTAFPCFDQPNLKATYSLTLDVPADWQAIANGDLEELKEESSRKKYRFKESDLLSTYLFAFVAGKFNLYRADLQKQAASLLYRETDTAKLSVSLPAIYSIHEQSLRFMESWTGIPYPFQKFGMTAIPDFQFGGMEHPGAVHYKESSLFLDRTATKDQLNNRVNLIAHETAHMWFGDLVTMDWFSDVWMKEVFANFMADKSTEAQIPQEESAQKFLISHVPAAYAVDRTPGANPIRQSLDNLNEAGTLYGNIIYHKAPVMMKQLETLMGKEAFQAGVKIYLKKFANGNASWPGLIEILDAQTPLDLISWNSVWVNDTGRPVISYQMENQDGKIKKLSVYQQAELGKKRHWPQQFQLNLYYKDHMEIIPVKLDGQELVLPQAEGLGVPVFMVFNANGEGYGRMPVDTNLPAHLFTIKSPLTRASAYISIFEQMLSGEGLAPKALLTLFSTGLQLEKDELNLKLICSYINHIYWQFSPEEFRNSSAAGIEEDIWMAMQRNTEVNQKKQLFRLYQDIFSTSSAGERLYQIWKDQKVPQGIQLTEDDYTSLALALALRSEDATELLDLQQLRIKNNDRKARFELLMPAVSADPKQRTAFFNSLKTLSGRAKEATVLSALNYLHHPLRQKYSVKYLRESLEMLVEIQKTGDIFFPQSWLQSTFGLYNSQEAAAVVESFLKSNPAYSPKLKSKILQATDNLFRARKMLQ